MLCALMTSANVLATMLVVAIKAAIRRPNDFGFLFFMASKFLVKDRFE